MPRLLITAQVRSCKIMKPTTIILIGGIIAALLFVLPASAQIAVNVQSLGSTYIAWTWPGGITAQNASLDGLTIQNFNGANNLFEVSGLLSNETHTFCVYSSTDSGCSTATTGSDTTTYALWMSVFSTYWLSFCVILMVILGYKLSYLFHVFGAFFALAGLAANLGTTPTMALSSLAFWIYLFEVIICCMLYGYGALS